jgi:DNA polymerase I-like protein with 3'-5' exonuclease and polymerase domains
LDEKRVRKYVQDVLDLPCDKIFFNAAYDVGWLKAEGFSINGKIIDAMIAAALIDENRFSYSLNALGFDYLQETKSEQGLRDAAKEFGVDPKAELYKLPAMYVGEYAEQDAALTLKLWQYFKIELIKQELSSIFELESALCPILIDMTFAGVRFDVSRAEQTMSSFKKKEREALAQIKSLSGISVDIWASASIAKAFDKLGISYGKTEKGAPSFTKNFLGSHTHPLARAIVDAREYNKATGTFVEGLLDYAKFDGRIHGHINQLRSDEGGTVSGRLSMANPNLQQIPARHPEIGPAIRSLFLPEEGEIWASLDFSQQEPRLAVHYAKLLDLKGADKAAEAYVTNPDTDFHQTIADMAGIGRKQAKTIGLGLLYGMGKGKMAGELDLSTEEAGELISKFHGLVPFMKGLVTAVQQRVDHPASNGSVRTLLGRRCRFNLWEPTEFGLHKPLPREQAVLEHGPRLKRAYTYKGLNRLIQGSAADQTKKSMLACFQAGKLPLLQVHDELCLSVGSVDEANKFAQIMMDCVKLEVPSKVDVETGPSWGEAE